MKQEELKTILTKYLSGIPLTDEEKKHLGEWDELFEKEEGLLASLNAGERDLLHARMWNHIEDQTLAPIVRLEKRHSWRKLAGIAAAVMLLLGVGAWWWFGVQSRKHVSIAQTKTNPKIMPGGDKAFLTLADGTIVQLDSAKNGMLAQQGNSTILKLDNGQIAYNVEAEKAGIIGYNIITTPVGGQFRVVLPDGSKIMLNAASSLRYPTQFTGNERRVTLTGEGYFEVIHSALHPFIVAVNDIEIHDLGTEFNINAYNDEPVIQTTLISGLAEIKKGGQVTRLEPGKTARIKGTDIELSDADVTGVTAWKNGLFQFDNAGIETIMRQVARWYDVEIVFENPVVQRHITGKAFRNSSLVEMLKILELSGIHFKVKGRKIIITD